MQNAGSAGARGGRVRGKWARGPWRACSLPPPATAAGRAIPGTHRPASTALKRSIFVHSMPKKPSCRAAAPAQPLCFCTRGGVVGGASLTSAPLSANASCSLTGPGCREQTAGGEPGLEKYRPRNAIPSSSRCWVWGIPPAAPPLESTPSPFRSSKAPHCRPCHDHGPSGQIPTSHDH